MSQKKICPLTQKACVINCSETGEFCFDMRRMCHQQVREGHKQFGKLAPFEDPPPERERSPDDPHYLSKGSHLRKHPKLDSVYFQGADKRSINPDPSKNEEAKRNYELRLQNALRLGHHIKPQNP